MSMPICGVNSMMPICGVNSKMPGVGFMNCFQKPEASEIANQIINNRDKDVGSLNPLGKLSENPLGKLSENPLIKNRDKDVGSLNPLGKLSENPLGKLSERLGPVEADFNEDGLIDQEKLVSKISEKLEKMEEVAKMRGLRMYRSFMNIQMPTKIAYEPTSVVSEPDIILNRMTSIVSENRSISDLVKQLLSRLDLSNEETETFLEVMKNYGINVTT